MPRVSRDGSPRTRDEASRGRGKAGIELLDDLLSSTTFFVRVGASEVEVELVREALARKSARLEKDPSRRTHLR